MYGGAIAEHFADENLDEKQLQARIAGVLGPQRAVVHEENLPEWLKSSVETAHDAGEAATADAKIARLVFMGMLAMFILLVALSDIACRNRIGRVIADAEASGVSLENSS